MTVSNQSLENFIELNNEIPRIVNLQQTWPIGVMSQFYKNFEKIVLKVKRQVYPAFKFGIQGHHIKQHFVISKHIIILSHLS